MDAGIMHSSWHTVFKNIIIITSTTAIDFTLQMAVAQGNQEVIRAVICIMTHPHRDTMRY